MSLRSVALLSVMASVARSSGYWLDVYCSPFDYAKSLSWSRRRRSLRNSRR